MQVKYGIWIAVKFRSKMITKLEKSFWTWLNAATIGLWHVQRHEDKYSVGIPDISYGAEGINGWIELKAYNKWPTSSLPHFTAKQANWLTNRGERGGHCFILIRIKSTILMFSWKESYNLLHKPCNEESLKNSALIIWDNTFDRKQFFKIITE